MASAISAQSAPHLRGHAGAQALVGPRAHQRFVERDADAVDVGAGVGRVAAELLGRDVARAARGPRARRGRQRQPEVGHPHTAVAVDEDVVGLEVAMDEARVVRRLQPAGGGDEDVEHLLDGAGPLAQPAPQRAALDQLHR